MDNPYFLNGRNLQEFGIIPGRGSGSNIALTGAWDMPVRTGKTHHIWPDHNGVEPYLRADEINFAGRDLQFTFFIKASDRRTAQLECYELFSFIDSLNAPAWFDAGLYGSYQVVIKDEVKIEALGNGVCSGTLTMRQPYVNMDGAVLDTAYGEPSIDGVSLESMGFVLISMTDQYNKPTAKGGDVTAYGYEAVKVTPSGLRMFNLELAIQSEGYQFGFKYRMQNLMAMLARPNARTLVHNRIKREFFCKDGFKVTRFAKEGDVFKAVLSIPCSEIRVLETYNLLTDNSGDQLTVGGIPLMEVLKIY